MNRAMAWTSLIVAAIAACSQPAARSGTPASPNPTMDDQQPPTSSPADDGADLPGATDARPPLDRDQPTGFATATFALG